MEVMLGILQNIISLLTGGIVGIARGIGTGIVELVKNLMFELSEQGAIVGLNAFGMVVCVFAGISLAIALSSKIYMMISSLGSKK